MFKSYLFIIVFSIIISNISLGEPQKEIASKSNQNEQNIKSEPVDTNSIEKRISKLETDIEVFNKSQETLVGALDGMVSTTQTMFNMGLGAIAILSIFTFAVQFYREFKEKKDFIQEKKDMKEENEKKDKFIKEENERKDKFIKEENEKMVNILKEQNFKYDEYIKNLDEKNKDLMNESKKNIIAITGLLTALQGIFTLKEKFEDQFKAAEEQIQQKRKEIIDANKKAMMICKELSRNTYRSPENRQLFQNFSNQYENRIEKDELNANAYLIFGLNAMLGNLFDLSEDLFKTTIDKTKYNPDDRYESLYPDKSPHQILAWLNKLSNITYYYYAIMEYNLGKYEKSEQIFKEALNFDKNDAKTMLYIPEAQFLGHFKSFDEITTEFESIEKRILNIEDTTGWGEKKESILAQLYLRFGNCYFPGCRHLEYRKKHDIAMAEEKYERACEYAPDLYIANFSYAQTLSLKASPSINISEGIKREARSKAVSLYRKVFENVKEKIGRTDEAKILIMYYYIMIICCKEGKIESENITDYIMEIYKAGSSLPTNKNLRIFSPLTKNDLIYDEIKKEVKDYEKTSELSEFF